MNNSNPDFIINRGVLQKKSNKEFEEEFKFQFLTVGELKQKLEGIPDNYRFTTKHRKKGDSSHNGTSPVSVVARGVYISRLWEMVEIISLLDEEGNPEL